MTSFLYVLNVVCSSGQSVLGKQYAKSGGNAAVFNMNKGIAGLAVFAILALIQGFSFHLPTVFLGVAYGVFLCLSMYTGFQALAIGPMALTSIIASFSLLIPFFFGICFWQEPVTWWSLCGITLLLLSIWLINGRKASNISLKWLLYAVATLVANGICSVIQKYHQIQFPSSYQTEFMVFSLLCVVLLLTLAPLLKRSSTPPFRLSVTGLLSGSFNGLANYIVLLLSVTENASTLFPIISVANIALACLSGRLFFKERLTGRQAVGLAVGALSVVLLKI